jgi:acetolactate synthase I/II/III large subunit
MKASDLFLRCLEAEGVDTIFGVPGEENADIMISLLTSNIKFITCRHEQTASFLADMHGRLTGKPGVCLATLGPGATNLLTGVANANMDHSPLIAIIGQASTHRLHKESHQNMDSITMYQPVSKWTTTIREPDIIPEVIRKAFKLATANKPGAVVIELPEDIAKTEAPTKPLPLPNKSAQNIEMHEVQAALALLSQSKYPLLLVGNGCVREECDDEITTFVDQTGAYAANTFMGKGTISADHPQSLHCVGLGMKDIALEAFDRADLIICAGYDLVEWAPERWNPNCDKTIIHIDTLPAEVDQHYTTNLELVGDIKKIFALINEHCKIDFQRDIPEFKAIRSRMLEDLSTSCDSDHFPMKPQRILRDLRSALSGKDILISDVGAHKMWVARQYPTYQSKTCFIFNGFCSMGGAMPGAIAAKMLNPDQHVVALCGDGGFMMSIQALATAVKCKIPITVLLWEDNHYGLIQWKQDITFHKESHTALHNPDLAKLAEAFGCYAISIKTSSELTPALEQASQNKEKPTVIIVPVDYSENMKLTKHLGDIVAK